MPYSVDLPVRYRDLDPRKHVNHAVYVTLFEEAKAAYYKDVLGVGLDDAPTVVRTFDIEYLGPISLDDMVTVEVTVSDIGETSFTMRYALFTNGDRAATGRTVSVMMTDDLSEPTPIPEEWRERIRAHGRDSTPP